MTERSYSAKRVSGLVRGIGPVTAVIIAVSLMVGHGWLRFLFFTAGQSPLPENLWFLGIPPIVMGFIIAGIAIVIIMLGYSVLSTAMPRSGGGYVAISRIIGPFWAFVGAWLTFLSLMTTFGGGLVFFFEYVFTGVGPAIGIVPAVAYNDVNFFAGGLLLIIAITVVIALGLRVTSYALQILFWIPAGLTVYVVFLLGVAIVNPATLQTGLGLWAQAQGVAGVTPDAYVKAALAQGLDAANVGNYWTATSSTLLYAYFAYWGYAALTFLGGEVKDPSRKLPKLLLVAPIIAMIMYASMSALGVYAAASIGRTTLPNGDTWSFYEAYSFLSFGTASRGLSGFPAFRATIPTLASMIDMALGLGPLNILLLIFAILWELNDIPPLALVGSRLLFAMSFDRVLPATLSRVDNRFHAPVVATVIAGVFAVLGALAESCVVCTGGSWNPGGQLGDILNAVFSNGLFASDLWDFVFYTLFALAVVLFPFRLKNHFDAAPFKPGGKLGVITIGSAGLIANLIIGWVVLTSPADSYNILAPTSDNLFALGFDILIALIGCIIYAYYRYGPSRRKTDYHAIFSEIPSE